MYNCVQNKEKYIVSRKLCMQTTEQNVHLRAHQKLGLYILAGSVTEAESQLGKYNTGK